MSTISTHVLDVSLGKPAAGVPVLIQRVRDDDVYDLRDVTIGAGTTDADGRLRDFLTAGGLLTQGVYRLRFDVAEYFRITSRETFFPEVAVLFRVGAAEEHYHVPVLISPFGYTTYRGT
jgi:5-hydroxyisourate hydrolase